MIVLIRQDQISLIDPGCNRAQIGEIARTKDQGCLCLFQVSDRLL